MLKILFILVIIFYGGLFAETVILKKGDVIRGSVIGQDSKILKVRTNGKTIEIPKRGILKVIYRDVSAEEAKQIKAAEEKKQEKTQTARAEEIHKKDGSIVYGKVKRHMGSAILAEINNKEQQIPLNLIHKIVFNKTITRDVLTRQIEAEQEQERLAREAEEEEKRKQTEKEKLITEQIELKTNYERQSHNMMIAESRRLPYTEGVLEYSGGQKIHTEMIELTEGQTLAKTEYGIIQLNDLDMGKTMEIILNDQKKTIAKSEIQPLKNTRPETGKIYLGSGAVFEGKILGVSGKTAIIESAQGKLAIPVEQITYPPTEPEKGFTEGIHVSKGEYAKFHFNDEQKINGRIVFRTEHSVILDTAYGMIEVNPAYIVSAVAAPSPQKKRGKKQ